MDRVAFTLFSYLLQLSVPPSQATPDCWQEHQAGHTSTDLSRDPKALAYLAETMGDEFEFSRHLDEILIPRVADSDNLRRVQKHISQHLQSVGWTVETDEFAQDTVDGRKNFANVIAHFNKDSPRRLVLACHYDTLTQLSGFLGAIDSAVPCAMLLNLATTLGPVIGQRNLANPELSLTLVFFDGEEAFRFFSLTDGLYGSRHLATRWNGTVFLNKDERFCQTEGRPASHLDRVDLLLLLDLIGAPAPKINHFKFGDVDSTYYNMLVEVEKALERIYPSELPTAFTGNENGGITDDHSPFLRLGFRRILHLIPTPFPSVWHKMSDNREALDFQLIKRLNMMMRVFVAQYLQYNGTRASPESPLHQSVSPD